MSKISLLPPEIFVEILLNFSSLIDIYKIRLVNKYFLLHILENTSILIEHYIPLLPAKPTFATAIHRPGAKSLDFHLAIRISAECFLVEDIAWTLFSNQPALDLNHSFSPLDFHEPLHILCALCSGYYDSPSTPSRNSFGIRPLLTTIPLLKSKSQVEQDELFSLINYIFICLLVSLHHRGIPLDSEDAVLCIAGGPIGWKMLFNGEISNAEIKDWLCTEKLVFGIPGERMGDIIRTVVLISGRLYRMSREEFERAGTFLER
ncbi:hypothetical protein NEOLI_002738 [Neolecta irregularis DAH-3]|uniref:F-box domain-containing protein n=1 Tax=Neolecta irregularis (strain DAH-3) TaxID=1198029 RepID=A0A1U7LWN8_NEOID|nr:hypothetical protein NEOLI_002738 [Neolecta irregularis DAH-3]|eukprot:OLL26962.1 hypothetical protein NEOLI_002738 [Neolecta irregularis DAH-3]